MTHRDQNTAIYASVEFIGEDGYALVAREYEDDAPVVTLLLGDELPKLLDPFKDRSWVNPLDLPIEFLTALHGERLLVLSRRMRNARR